MLFVSDLSLGLWNAWIFMSVFLLQMLVITFADKRIREKSHVPTGARRNTLEKYAGILGNIIWLLALAYSIFLPIQLDTIWFYPGLFVFMVGLIMLTIATFDFITTPADYIITKGIYQCSRHPMYLATFLICFGSAIASVSWLFVFFSLIMVLCFHQEALIEERFCLDKYGSAYQGYLNNVPRWFGFTHKTK